LRKELKAQRKTNIRPYANCPGKRVKSGADLRSRQRIEVEGGTKTKRHLKKLE